MKRPFLLLLCVGMLGACAAQDTFENFIREKPPCRLPPLTEEQVTAAARKALGESFFMQDGLPERPHRVIADECIYRFEYPILSHGNEWFSFDAIDGTGEILISRDFRIFMFNTQVVIPK